MPKIRDLTGLLFGSLVALRPDGRNAYRQVMWLVRCDCGKQRTVIGNKLVRGALKSCGCQAVNLPVAVPVGTKFGRWTVIGEGKVLKPYSRSLCYPVRCSCGSASVVPGSKLRYGGSLSCGCLVAETTRELNKQHGETGSPEHRTWKALRKRCNNPNTKQWMDYGGRGITCCRRWDKFENFLADMGRKPKGLTIERMNNSKGYSPKNCKWATWSEQNNNKRPRKDRKQKV